MNTEELTAMIQKIIENPEFGGFINDIRGEETNTQDMLKKLPEVMAMVQPILGSTNENTEEKKQEQTEIAAIVPKKYDKVRAEKLMNALKPYLSSHRCDMIDKCLSVMQISDVMSVFGGLEGIMKRE